MASGWGEGVGDSMVVGLVVVGGAAGAVLETAVRGGRVVRVREEWGSAVAD